MYITFLLCIKYIGSFKRKITKNSFTVFHIVAANKKNKKIMAKAAFK